MQGVANYLITLQLANLFLYFSYLLIIAKFKEICLPKVMGFTKT